MTDQPRPPLWRDVDNAWWAYVDTESPVCLPPSEQAANVIRAVADWLVPRELPSVMECDDEYMTRYKQRQELRQLLLDEARRAEAGE